MRRVAASLVVALLVVACTGGQSGQSTTTSPEVVSTTVPTVATTTPDSTTTDTSTATTIGDTSLVRAQLDWFVRTINGEPMSDDVYVERFAEVFRLQVPYETQFARIIQQLEAVPGDWIVVSYTELTPEDGVGIVAAGDERMQVSVSVDSEANLITGLLIQPADLPSAPDSFENAIGRLQDLGTLRLVAAEVSNGACEPVEQVSADQPMPLGSVFKLFVLGTLADATDQGDVSWEDEVIIRDDLKSIPSGILQDEPDGTVRTVREVAELMISISDNTATDHLIDLLGRQRIEEHLDDLGLSQPALNIPFLTTREFAALKIGPASGLRVQYLDADEAGKREILQQISDITPADLPVSDFDEPIEPDRLEWFASAADLCTVLAGLWNDGGEEVRDILTVNPGVAPSPGLWDSVAFKGGSEPGLLTVAWLTVAGDRTFVLTGSVVNTSELIDEFEAPYLFSGARDLLAPGG